jgi:hypothetical protein
MSHKRKTSQAPSAPTTWSPYRFHRPQSKLDIFIKDVRNLKKIVIDPETVERLK